MLLENLKTQTRPQHQRLESLNGLPATRADYVRMLERFYGFVAPWEARVAARLPAEDPLRAGRAKTAWLEADLEQFGRDEADRARLPRCVELPVADSRAAILGACYVFEGSTLGGQVITRHLHERLGIEAGAGDRYFRSYGPEVGVKWQAFRAELLRHSSPENDPRIVAAARETFEKLGAWFGGPEEAAA